MPVGVLQRQRARLPRRRSRTTQITAQIADGPTDGGAKRSVARIPDDGAARPNDGVASPDLRAVTVGATARLLGTRAAQGAKREPPPAGGWRRKLLRSGDVETGAGRMGLAATKRFAACRGHPRRPKRVQSPLQWWTRISVLVGWTLTSSSQAEMSRTSNAAGCWFGGVVLLVGCL